MKIKSAQILLWSTIMKQAEWIHVDMICKTILA